MKPKTTIPKMLEIIDFNRGKDSERERILKIINKWWIDNFKDNYTNDMYLELLKSEIQKNDEFEPSGFFDGMNINQKRFKHLKSEIEKGV